MPALVPMMLLLAASEEILPARWMDGAIPGLSPLASSGGRPGLELRVTASGIVEEAVVVDDAPPFTEELKKVARLWRFAPATRDGEAIPARVALVGVFRPKTLLPGDPPPPQRVNPPSKDTPYPLATATPSYPPNALFEGVVMMEVEVDADGGIAGIETIGGTEGFSGAALEAVRKFRFPARPGRVLVVFGFPQPLTLRKPPGGERGFP